MNNNIFESEKLLIFDGAVGTELYNRGFFINRPFEELNTSSPADVQKVHFDYLSAGADVITTNTFAATHTQLKNFDLDKKQSELVSAALQNANRAVEQFHKNTSREVSIALSLGPLGQLVEPLGSLSLVEARAEFAEVARAAVQSGEKFQLYLFETFSNLDELEAAVAGVREIDSVRPILASIHSQVSKEGFIAEFADRFGKSNLVQALGLNCSDGPSQLLQALQILKPLTSKPIVVQPNAGLPRAINGRYFYMTSPDYLAKFAKRYVQAGAVAVGGCCGTGPEHIRAISSAFAMVRAQVAGEVSDPEISAEVLESKQDRLVARARSQIRKPAAKTSILSTSQVGEKLKAGKKIISIEVLPPKGTELEGFLKSLETIEKAGVDFVNVPDGARASTRVSSLHVASYVAHRKGSVRVIPHFTTRDRNLIALQSDLLGAYVNGVRDVLLITGDPPKLGTNKDATAVYDIDSIGLTYLVNCLNQGISPTGDEIGTGTGFGIGVASNPTAINLDLEYQRWLYKIESGADYAVTQPIFDPDSFMRWKDRLKTKYRPHVVGIWPLTSLRNAEFMANEVPGVHVPKWVLEEMAKAGGNADEASKRGLEIAQKCVSKLNQACEGFCVSAPFGKVHAALHVVGDLK